LLGREAQEVLTGFDTRQRQQMRGAAEDLIGGRLAPNAVGREAATLGSRVRSATNKSWQQFQQEEDKLWRAAGSMYPAPAALTSPPQFISQSVNRGHIVPKPGMHPSADAMLNELGTWMKGEVTTPPYDVLGPGRGDLMDLDEMRRTLLANYMGAERGSA